MTAPEESLRVSDASISVGRSGLHRSSLRKSSMPGSDSETLRYTSQFTTEYLSCARISAPEDSFTSSTSGRVGSALTWTSIPISQRSRFGDQISERIYSCGTRSNQTVRQIPLVRGYQIE